MDTPIGKSHDIPLGEIMTRKNGKKYQVVLSPGWAYECKACAFHDKTTDFCEGIPCTGLDRADGHEVVFIRRKDLETDPDEES